MEKGAIGEVQRLNLSARLSEEIEAEHVGEKYRELIDKVFSDRR